MNIRGREPLEVCAGCKDSSGALMRARWIDKRTYRVSRGAHAPATRLLAAMAVGALIGNDRERVGKSAGLRTHMLVSMGTALFVISALEVGMSEDAVSRVIQGVITGIGFLGAGVIMKIQEAREIGGLTTSAGVWMTVAASVAIGLGLIGIGVIAGVLAWLVLAALSKLDGPTKPTTPEGNA